MLHRFHLQILDRTWCDFSLMVFERLRRRYAQAKEGLDEHGDSTLPVAWPTIREDLCEFTKDHTGLLFRVTIDDATPAYVSAGRYTPCCPDQEYSGCLR